MLESQGVLSDSAIREAYQCFQIQLEHANVISDNIIIDRYNARLPDVGADERSRMKQMLRILGDARDSPAIRNAASESECPVDHS